MEQPKDIFENEEELRQYTKWWQEKLFLLDWNIISKICDPEDFVVPDREGENEFNIVNKCSVIRILDHKRYREPIVKYCGELILVHELLHCKYNWIENETSYEGKYVDVMEHSLLEQMAKSLIMTKYNVGLEYFINN